MDLIYHYLLFTCSTGLTFLESKNVLPAGSFVSYEAINWIRNNCSHVHSFMEAAKVLQVW